MEPYVSNLVPSAVPVEAVGHDFAGYVATPEYYGDGFVDRFGHSKTIIKPENSTCQLGVTVSINIKFTRI